MKSTLLLIVVSLCIGPSLCAWGIRPRASGKSGTTTSLTSSLPPDSGRMGLQRRVGKPDDEKDYEDVGSLELDGIESTIINGTDQEERFFNRFPLHVFMKKKRPFVSFSTVTQTSTVTALVTSSTVGLCAKLVNVTGACRLRRGMWVDDPIVLSFDDDMDSIDQAFSPSKTLSIETTSTPEAMVDARGGRSSSDAIENGTRDRRISVRSGSVIHSSKEDEAVSRDDNDHESRFGFFGLKDRIRNKMKFITVITTTVVTSTSTSTYYVTVSTKTFYIQLCTPSPFPFNICQGRKKRQLEIEQQQNSQ